MNIAYSHTPTQPRKGSQQKCARCGLGLHWNDLRTGEEYGVYDPHKGERITWKIQRGKPHMIPEDVEVKPCTQSSAATATGRTRRRSSTHSKR